MVRGRQYSEKGLDNFMSKVLVFDTETTNAGEKPFVYNIGWCVLDTDEGIIVEKKDYVVDQTYNNIMLFSTAYYADKRDLYTRKMRGRKTLLRKFGIILNDLRKTIEYYDIAQAYAYNSDFDKRVFKFNCEFFNKPNPFDDVEIFDIWAYASQYISNSEKYKAFCENHEYFTESGNYSGNAETVYRYISGNLDFEEEHTALSDSIIECEILQACINNGAEYGTKYRLDKIIPRLVPQTLTIKSDNETFTFDYLTKKVYKKKNLIILKKPLDK